MDNIKTLIVAPWGLPAGWRLVEYAVPTPPSELKDYSRLYKWGLEQRECVKSYSSTAAIAKLFVERNHNVVVAVYGLDTLATPSLPDLEKIPVEEEARRKLVERVHEILKENYSSYAEIMEKAEEVLKLFAEEYIMETCRKQVELHIKVLPGVGVFKKARFSGSTWNFYTALTLDLTNLVLRSNPDVIILDLSHGINYMPVLAYKSVDLITKFLSAYTSSVKYLVIFNSDPVTTTQPSKPHAPPSSTTQQRGAGEERAYLHIIDAVKVEPRITSVIEELIDLIERDQQTKVFRMLSGEKPPTSVAELQRKIQNLAERVLQILKGFQGSASYGIVLYTSQKLIELSSSKGLEEIEEYSNKLYRDLIEVLNQRKVSSKEVLEVKHEFALTPSVTALYIAVKLLGKLAVIAEKIKYRKTRAGEQEILLISLESLEHLVKELGLKEAAREIANYELGDMKKRLNTFIERYKLTRDAPYYLIPYSVVYDTTSISDKAAGKKNKEETGEQEKTCYINERHFYAHAGMERNTIVVTLDKYVGYKPLCKQEIDKLIQKTRT